MAGIRYFEPSFFALNWQDVVNFNAPLIEVSQGTLSLTTRTASPSKMWTAPIRCSSAT